jgi:predicted Rossmann-fold nucleotide-binding protein
MDWIKAKLLDEKNVSPEDMEILQVVDDPEEIVKKIKRRIIQ